jgi:hypothetical protein
MRVGAQPRLVGREQRAHEPKSTIATPPNEASQIMSRRSREATSAGSGCRALSSMKAGSDVSCAARSIRASCSISLGSCSTKTSLGLGFAERKGGTLSFFSKISARIAGKAFAAKNGLLGRPQDGRSFSLPRLRSPGIERKQHESSPWLESMHGSLDDPPRRPWQSPRLSASGSQRVRRPRTAPFRDGCATCPMDRSKSSRRAHPKRSTRMTSWACRGPRHAVVDDVEVEKLTSSAEYHAFEIRR